MRDILFRGKRLDNGSWYFGSYLFLHVPDLNWTGQPWGPASDVHFIVNQEDYNFAVDPETVGQYTGLTDQNDKKVFEGDVVKMHYFFENYDPGTLGVFEDEDVLDVVIKIDKFGVFFEALNRELSGYLCDYLQDPEAELEVIGNIYDNPGLLREIKGGQSDGAADREK